MEISALEIEPDPGTPAIAVSPRTANIVNLGNQRQFYAVGMFTSDSVTWSISPGIGSIDAHGLYRAPCDTISSDVNVVIKATSILFPSISDTVTIKVLKEIPPVRMNCGGAQITDALGHVWAADYNYSDTSTAYASTNTVTGVLNGQESLYQSSRFIYRYQNGTFRYDLPTANSPYNVTLKFANYNATSDSVKMDVAINGDTVLKNFDIVAAAGGVQKAYDQTFKTRVTNCHMLLEFIPKSKTALVGARINAFEFEFDSMATTGINEPAANTNKVLVYPNPFTGKTTINYTLSNGSNGDIVRMVIYDITGKEITTLVNAEQYAGSHSVNFDAEGIAGGIYFYRLQTGNTVSNGKLIVVK